MNHHIICFNICVVVFKDKEGRKKKKKESFGKNGSSRSGDMSTTKSKRKERKKKEVGRTDRVECLDVVSFQQITIQLYLYNEIFFVGGLGGLLCLHTKK